MFTKERGKLAARARGVRKLGSRMGGTLLPPQHVSVQLHEGASGNLITDASRLTAFAHGTVDAFLHAQQGMELLLALLHDEEPLPELFTVTLRFLERCGQDPHSMLPFTLTTLKILGLLPAHNEPFFADCSAAQKLMLQQCGAGNWDDLPTLSQQERSGFSVLCGQLLSGAISSPLKSGAVIGMMRNRNEG